MCCSRVFLSFRKLWTVVNCHLIKSNKTLQEKFDKTNQAKLPCSYNCQAQKATKVGTKERTTGSVIVKVRKNSFLKEEPYSLRGSNFSKLELL